MSTLADLPASSAARRAIEACRRYSTPALLDHSIRSYLWAAQYAREQFITAFQAEAARQPQCAVARLLSTGWLNRMSSNPLPR